MSEKIFVDSDIILDVFLNREPFLNSAMSLFNLVKDQHLEGFTSPLIINNVHYILSKTVGQPESLRKLKSFRLHFRICPVSEKHIDSAFASDFPDFEDAIQYYSALENSIDFIITRNKKDFGKSIIPVMSAEEFINYFKSVSKN